MLISSLSRPNQNFYINKNNRDNTSYNSNPDKKNDYGKFVGRNIYFSGKPINKLYEEYNWYINHDHTPAIDAFLKIEDDRKTMDGFLSAILNTDDRSYQLIDSIVRQPRRANEISKKLADKVGSDSKNLMTYYFNSPYHKAYTKYIDSKYQNAHTLSELIKVRPDWSEQALIEKSQQLKGSQPLEIGCIPKEFPSNHIFAIADYLSGFMDFGFKAKKHINSLKLDNREYEFKFFTEGKSDKNVFGVFTPEHKKYVIKMSDKNFRSLDKPFALGTLAKIDTYLTTNRSRNSAPLCYYNHDRNMSVYKYMEHKAIENPSKDLGVISSHLPDFTSLGLSYNDTVGEKNFFKLALDSNEDMLSTNDFIKGVENNEWVSVDNDHVTFNNIWQPLMTKYHKSLPNAMQMFF